MRPNASEIREALRTSLLGSLPEDLLAELAGDAMLRDVPAGTDLIREGEPWSGMLLVVAGLLKTYLTSPDGRQIAIRYARPGSLVGTGALFAEGPARAASRAVTPARVLSFDAATLKRLARSRLELALVLCRELAARLNDYFGELGGTAFTSVRQRVARHLLDVATERPRGRALVAELSQQGLADAVGSVREVVGRVLGRLREEGLVRTGQGEIEILDRPSSRCSTPARLPGSSTTGSPASSTDWATARSPRSSRTPPG